MLAAARISQELVVQLKGATPVDTGNARDHWKVHPVSPHRYEIQNTVPYIKELNAGSSEQAPAFFIERTVLANKEVAPDGAVVQYR